MKKRKTWIFHLSLFLLLFSLALPLQAQETKKKEDEKKSSKKEEKKTGSSEFVSKKHNFAFTPPKDWASLTPTENFVAIFASKDKFPNLNVKVKGKSKWSNKKYLIETLGEAIVSRYKSKFKIVTSKSEVHSWKSEKGQKKYSVLDVELRGVQLEKGKEMYTIFQRIVFFSDATLIFTFTAKGTEYNDQKATFLKSLDSLHRTSSDPSGNKKAKK